MIFQYTDWTNTEHPNVTRRNYQDLFSDSVFKAPAIKMAQALVKKNHPTYLYQVREFYAIMNNAMGTLNLYNSANISGNVSLLLFLC